MTWCGRKHGNYMSGGTTWSRSLLHRVYIQEGKCNGHYGEQLFDHVTNVWSHINKTSRCILKKKSTYRDNDNLTMFDNVLSLAERLYVFFIVIRNSYINIRFLFASWNSLLKGKYVLLIPEIILYTTRHNMLGYMLKFG